MSVWKVTHYLLSLCFIIDWFEIYFAVTVAGVHIWSELSYLPNLRDTFQHWVSAFMIFNTSTCQSCHVALHIYQSKLFYAISGTYSESPSFLCCTLQSTIVASHTERVKVNVCCFCISRHKCLIQRPTNSTLKANTQSPQCLTRSRICKVTVTSMWQWTAVFFTPCVIWTAQHWICHIPIPKYCKFINARDLFGEVTTFKLQR